MLSRHISLYDHYRWSHWRASVCAVRVCLCDHYQCFIINTSQYHCACLFHLTFSVPIMFLNYNALQISITNGKQSKLLLSGLYTLVQFSQCLYLKQIFLSAHLQSVHIIPVVPYKTAPYSTKAHWQGGNIKKESWRKKSTHTHTYIHTNNDRFIIILSFVCCSEKWLGTAF